MPDAKDNAKLTGDTHPPELEDRSRRTSQGRPKAFDADATPADQELSRDLENESRAGQGVNPAGDLKDNDAPGSGGNRQR